MSGPDTFDLWGIQVVVSPLVQPVARVALSHDFTACSPEFKATFNAWLRAQFGTKEVVYWAGPRTLMVSPAALAQLRRQYANSPVFAAGLQPISNLGDNRPR